MVGASEGPVESAHSLPTRRRPLTAAVASATPRPASPRPASPRPPPPVSQGRLRDGAKDLPGVTIAQISAEGVGGCNRLVDAIVCRVEAGTFRLTIDAPPLPVRIYTRDVLLDHIGTILRIQAPRVVDVAGQVNVLVEEGQVRVSARSGRVVSLTAGQNITLPVKAMAPERRLTRRKRRPRFAVEPSFAPAAPRQPSLVGLRADFDAALAATDFDGALAVIEEINARFPNALRTASLRYRVGVALSSSGDAAGARRIFSGLLDSPLGVEAKNRLNNR